MGCLPLFGHLWYNVRIMDEPTKHVTFAISVQEELRLAAETQAEKQGVSVSEWAGTALLAALPRSVARKIPPRRGRGRPRVQQDGSDT